MGIWPFGKGKNDEEEVDEIDFASRVITASPSDGTTVRFKLTIHLAEATTQALVDQAIAAASREAEELVRETSTHAELLGEEASLATLLLGRTSAASARIRSIDIVALHVVDDGSPLSTTTPRPPSVAPPSRRPSSMPPAKQPLPSSPDKPSSTPPKAASMPPTAMPSSIPPPVRPGSMPPSPKPGSMPSSPMSSALPASRRPGSMPSIGGMPPSRRHSSGQMLAVRSERLVPLGATPEVVAKSLVPLMRDEATKLLIAVLRAYDLLVVRTISVDASMDGLDAIMPVSTVPLGFFANSRIDELERWESALGILKLEALRGEAATIACYLLHQALEHGGVGMTASTTILERIAEEAFDQGSTPLARIGRYLHLIEGSPAGEFGSSVVKIVGHADKLEKLETALTPVLASLQEDLSLAATQAYASLTSP